MTCDSARGSSSVSVSVADDDGVAAAVYKTVSHPLPRLPHTLSLSTLHPLSLLAPLL